MKRIFKTLGRVLLGLAGIAVIGYAGILVVNRSDRPVSAAASRLEKIEGALPQVRDQDNGFVYAMGFGAGVGQDPAVLGAQRVAWTHQMTGMQSADIPRDFPTRDQRPGPEPAPGMTELGKACKVVDAACYAALEGGADTIDAWLAADAALLERYMGLLSMPAWRETAAFDGRLPVPAYALVFEGQRLLLLQAWRAAGRGDAATVNRLLERDGVFWRTALASSDTLISKMMARASVARNLEWGSLVLRRFPAAAAAAAVPAHWRQEMSAQERSLLRSSAGGYKYAARALQLFYGDRRAASDKPKGGLQPDDLLFVVMRPTFQQQDYKNRYAELVTATSDMLDAPYQAYPAAVARARALIDTTNEHALDHPAYNWPGSLMLATRLPDFTDNSTAVTDLEGLRRLALLAVQLRVAKVTPADVPRQLGEASLRNPYDGKPFGWSDGALVFTGMQALPGGRHAIVY